MSHTFDAFNSWKALAYSDRIDDILRGDFPTPVTVHIYPTNRCNRNCTNCIMATERQGAEELPRDVFIRLLEDLNECDVKAIQIVGGGEPTLYPYLDEVWRFHGTRLLTTNGLELTRETARMFDRVRVSVNAASDAVYQEYHGAEAGEFAGLVETLKQVALHPRDYQLGYAMVGDACNWHEIPELCRLADTHRVDFVHIRPAWYPKGSAAGEEVHRLAPAMYHAAEAAKKAFDVPIYAISEKFSGFWGQRNYSRCRATPLNAVVTADGRMSVCLDVFHKFGNLHEQGIWDVWGSAEHRAAIGKICLGNCPRCVLDMPNQIMEHMFLEDECLLGVL